MTKHVVWAHYSFFFSTTEPTLATNTSQWAVSFFFQQWAHPRYKRELVGRYSFFFNNGSHPCYKHESVGRYLSIFLPADPTLATNASQWAVFLSFFSNGPHPRYKCELVGRFISLFSTCYKRELVGCFALLLLYST
jgi:hypothetical protein